MSKPTKFDNVAPDVLSEILRESEAKLQAQLDTSLASDMRAMTYFGYSSAISLTALGAGVSLYHTNGWLGMLAVTVGTGFSISSFFAFAAAKPVLFQLPGADPSEWIKDVEEGAPLRKSQIDAVTINQEKIVINRKTMATSARWMKYAAIAALVTLALAAPASIWYVAHLSAPVPPPT